MSQTTYSADPSKAFPGMVDAGPTDSLSRANGQGAEMDFGLAVSPDAVNGDTQFEEYDGSTVLGVLRHEHQLAEAGVSSVASLAEASVLTKGRVWVKIEETIAVGDPVFVRSAAGGGGSEIGAFRNDADTATAIELTSGARWVQGGTAAEGVALLELNLPA